MSSTTTTPTRSKSPPKASSAAGPAARERTSRRSSPRLSCRFSSHHVAPAWAYAAGIHAVALGQHRDVVLVRAADGRDAARDVVGRERHARRVGAVGEPAVPASSAPQRRRAVAPDPDRQPLLHRLRRERHAFDGVVLAAMRDLFPGPELLVAARALRRAWPRAPSRRSARRTCRTPTSRRRGPRRT